MPIAHLDDRAIVSVSGPDAEHFLQNIVTADLDALGVGVAKPSALLSPQGKILFDFLVSRAGENSLLLECRSDAADDLVRRLMLYRLRARVDIEKPALKTIAVRWDTYLDREQSEDGLIDLRFAIPHVYRHYDNPPVSEHEPADWHHHRILEGVAESGTDYALGDAFPHDVLLDELGGVGFGKGCYVGQEVVSRMQHRGTARRRILIADAECDLPAPGTIISVGGRPIGTLGSVNGLDGLALVRIDKVAEAMRDGTPALADGVPLHLEIPLWAKFIFPVDASGSESA